MTTASLDYSLLLDSVGKFCKASGNFAVAAQRLGVSKGTLSKWLTQKCTIRASSLKALAAFEDDAELAAAARKLLNTSRTKIASFNFDHIAAQFLCAGASTGMLLQMLERKASDEDLEFGAAYDLVSAFADTQYCHVFTELALCGFEYLPDSPLPRDGYASYEEIVFPEEIYAAQVTDPTQIDLNKIDWDKIDEPRARRSEAARMLLDCARNEPRHCLFDKIVDTLYCRARKREEGGISFTKEECLKAATLAAADCYVHESVVMEAGNTIRLAKNADRALERSGLHALATKLYEICYLNRTFTMNRVIDLTSMLGDDKETVGMVEGMCAFVEHALYSEKGAYFFHAGFASAKVNAHGSVIDYESGPAVRSVVGKKRQAPKQAIVRDKSVPRSPRRRVCRKFCV